MNKIVFISGINGQLGQCMADKLINEDWQVFGIDLDKSSTSDNRYQCIKGTVSSRLDWKNLFKLSEPYLQNDTIISLINNAGISIFTDPCDRTLEEFQKIMEVNVYGSIVGMTEFYKFITRVKELQTNITSKIINITSIYGHISPNSSIYTDTSRNSSEVYGASKAALAHLTKYFAVKYAEEDIQVNALSPGGVLNESLQGEDFIRRYSNLVPQKRMCQDSEIAEAAASILQFPCYVTGQIILADGGMSSW